MLATQADILDAAMSSVDELEARGGHPNADGLAQWAESHGIAGQELEDALSVPATSIEQEVAYGSRSLKKGLVEAVMIGFIAGHYIARTNGE